MVQTGLGRLLGNCPGLRPGPPQRLTYDRPPKHSRAHPLRRGHLDNESGRECGNSPKSRGDRRGPSVKRDRRDHSRLDTRLGVRAHGCQRHRRIRGRRVAGVADTVKLDACPADDVAGVSVGACLAAAVPDKNGAFLDRETHAAHKNATRMNRAQLQSRVTLRTHPCYLARDPPPRREDMRCWCHGRQSRSALSFCATCECDESNAADQRRWKRIAP